MSQLDEILADVKVEGDNPFPDEEKETPSESLPENNEEADEPDQGDPQGAEGENTDTENVPFHKHPRWQQREDELKRIREENENLHAAINELSTFKTDVEQRFSQIDGPSIPPWFSELYGENPEAWKKFSQYDQQLRQDIKREVIEEQRLSQQRAHDEERYWDEWVGGQVAELEREGHTFDKNALMKVMLDYRPTDAENNLDFRAGLKILEAVNTKAPTAERSIERKRIADTTTRSGGSEAGKKDFLTQHDLRGKGWNQL